jgi:hypothetical protein
MVFLLHDGESLPKSVAARGKAAKSCAAMGGAEIPRWFAERATSSMICNRRHDTTIADAGRTNGHGVTPNHHDPVCLNEIDVSDGRVRMIQINETYHLAAVPS